MASSSEDGACLRRKIAGREVPRRWAGDDSEDESARDQNRVRPQRANACLPSAALREAGAILLLDRARRRRTACPSRPDPQVSWCGKHLFRRYLHIRGRMRGAPADHRKGLAHLRGSRDSRANGDTESEICRFPTNHAKPDRSGALFDASRIEQLSYALREPLFPVTKGIRLLGMTLSSLAEKQLESEPQLSL